MEIIKNKWALVTGASRGIGREIAKRLAENGMNLVLHSRNVEHNQTVEKEVAALGVSYFSVGADLSDQVAIIKMINEVNSKVTISVLYNNAGIQTTDHEDYFQVNTEEFLLSYKVNLIAPILLIEGFVPNMMKEGFGRIINVTRGIKNQPEQAAYTASKGALDKITKDLSSKFIGKDISLNLLDPGWIKTDLGGENASHEVETVYPGVLVSVINKQPSNGNWINAQAYRGMTLEDAVNKYNQNVIDIN